MMVSGDDIDSEYRLKAVATPTICPANDDPNSVPVALRCDMSRVSKPSIV